MGIETALAIGAGSQAVGGLLQYGENRAARKRASKASDQAMGIVSAPTGINIGQDSLLQMLRSNPSALKPFQFDSSTAFKDFAAQDALDLNDQLNAQSAGAGSLGKRFGSGFAASSALLRSRVLANRSARNAEIAQSSFNNALNFGFQDQSQKIGLLQLMQNGVFQQRAQQLQALGLGASVPGTGAGQIVGQTGSDISTLLLLSQFLNNKKPGSTGGSVPTPTSTPSYGGGWPG